MLSTGDVNCTNPCATSQPLKRLVNVVERVDRLLAMTQWVPAKMVNLSDVRLTAEGYTEQVADAVLPAG